MPYGAGLFDCPTIGSSERLAPLVKKNRCCAAERRSAKPRGSRRSLWVDRALSGPSHGQTELAPAGPPAQPD